MTRPWPALLAAAALALASGCTDPAQIDNPLFNHHLGRTTGLFAAYRPQDYLCELLTIGETHLVWLLYRDEAHPDLGLRFDPLPRTNERYQGNGNFQFKLSDINAADAYAVLEQLPSIEDVRPHAVPTKYFPLLVHHLRVPSKTKLCDTLSDDCIEVPESEIFDSTFWCEDLSNR
ncbi:MAG: hypothetical protein K1X89_11370 [Myxococcaceae bacterium]|nr:hypothetical protein [Myxococcaceae bacterium]